MYVKPQEQRDLSTLLRFVEETSFGVLVTSGNRLEAAHIPFLLASKEPTPGTVATLQCHVAKANPIWRDLDGAEVLVILQGPDAYVSPSWYPSKARHGRAVPTWNFVAVHARGTSRVIDDSTWLYQHLSDLTDRHESGRPKRWRISDSPGSYIEAQMRAVIGVEIGVTQLEGKWKMSQNKDREDRDAVQQMLRQEAPQVAVIMEQIERESQERARDRDRDPAETKSEE
jgi:transcriptional regulator